MFPIYFCCFEIPSVGDRELSSRGRAPPAAQAVLDRAVEKWTTGTRRPSVIVFILPQFFYIGPSKTKERDC